VKFLNGRIDYNESKFTGAFPPEHYYNPDLDCSLPDEDEPRDFTSIAIEAAKDTAGILGNILCGAAELLSDTPYHRFRRRFKPNPFDEEMIERFMGIDD
jgi:hypothetical protein